ncbi:oxygenase MpaB family protein [Arthrobacter sp. lap29]|uniref:oxygenase MpaB family protein n=1 Tax=Arthrobacter sp. lap29 TaxID=3056122 RepID=UPI0028F6FB3C|nr:oxygenase MpaB family protein [Arthrobacter sp. lap29]
MVFGRGIKDIAPEAIMLAGAGRAILLQLANPAIGYGVARHSSFALDPLKRFHGTLAYIYAITNGTPQQRASMVSQVHRAHRPVSSAGSDSPHHYHAQDGELQLWVAATLYDSGMQIYNKMFPALAEEDAQAIYRDYGSLGTALGMPAKAWPATTEDFKSYWDEQLARLGVDETTQNVAAQLLAARSAPLWIRAAMPLARFLTAGLLPATVREMFDLPWSVARERWLNSGLGLMRVLIPFTPQWIRHAPMRYYLKRIPG